MVRLDLNKLQMMASNPYFFQLMLAALTRCNRAIIRLDTVHLLDDDLEYNRPRITSQLLTVKRSNNGAIVLANHPHLEYFVSVNGDTYKSMLYDGQWEPVQAMLSQATYGQIYVPTDLGPSYIQAEFKRGLQKYEVEEAKSESANTSLILGSQMSGLSELDFGLNRAAKAKPKATEYTHAAKNSVALLALHKALDNACGHANNSLVLIKEQCLALTQPQDYHLLGKNPHRKLVEIKSGKLIGNYVAEAMQ